MSEEQDEAIEQVIIDGILFMRSLTHAYGSEKGLELWDNISSSLDQEIRGKMFFRMLTGEGENTVTLLSVSANPAKINAIKIIRQYTGMGLMDAKTTYESVEYYNRPITIKLTNPKDRRSMIEDLTRAGLKAK